MALIVAKKETVVSIPVKTLKVHIYEVVEKEPMKWVPTGRTMYIDRDAPLTFLKGWQAGCAQGEMTLSKTIFDQIVKIVDDHAKKFQAEDEEAA